MAVTNTNGSHADVRCIFSPETSPAGAANARHTMGSQFGWSREDRWRMAFLYMLFGLSISKSIYLINTTHDLLFLCRFSGGLGTGMFCILHNAAVK